MNPHRPLAGAPAYGVRRFFRLSLAWLLATAVAGTAFSQSSSVGKITGRIFSPATQQYVRNAEIRVSGTDLVAYSGDDGSYVLTNVPAGENAVTVSYTGYDAAAAKVNVGPDAAATLNFDLKGSTYQPTSPPAATKKEGELIKLDSF